MLKPWIIDIEASGLGRGSYPIEIGFVKASGVTHCTLIKPPEGWTFWTQEAENLHGISQKLLDEKGRDVLWVAQWLNGHLKGHTVYSDGWANDMCWLGKLFDKADVVQQFKIESILTLLLEEEKEHWTPMHDKVLKASLSKRHRASSDAKVIQQTLLNVKQECNSDIKEVWFNQPGLAAE